MSDEGTDDASMSDEGTDDASTGDDTTGDASTGGELEPEVQLETPDPPDDLAYADFEDYRARALLDVNGVGTAVPELIETLDHADAVLRGAAAHALGALGAPGALGARGPGRTTDERIPLAEPLIGEGPIEALRRLAKTADDLVQVEAAYALVRLGVDEGRDVLRAALERPTHAYLSPAVAAGDLARLGDPTGFDVVVRCIADDNLIVKTLGCKQLLFFVPLDGHERSDGADSVDVFSQFRLALVDDSPEIQHLALLQLSEIPEQAKSLLQDYLSADGSAWKQLASQILAAGTETDRTDG